MGNAIELDLTKKITETSQADTIPGATIPKGTQLEDSLKPPPEVKNIESVIEKRKPGRPKGSGVKPKESEAATPAKQPDAITPMINGLVIPQVAKYYNKEAKDCMYSDEQAAMLAQMQPPNSGIQPSWFWYSVTAVALLLGNVMQAKEIKREKEEIIKDLKDALTEIKTPSRTDVPEMQAEPV
jgi:hypothetical protein